MIGQRLLNGHSRDLRDDIVQTLQMLDIQRRINIDAGGENLFHILPAFRVPTAFGIRMGEFIYQQQVWMPSQRGIQIELAQCHAAIRHAARFQLSKSIEQRDRIGTIMRFHITNDDIAPFRSFTLSRLQHCERLADPRRIAEENLQPPPLGTLVRLPHAGQQRIRIRSSIFHKTESLR